MKILANIAGALLGLLFAFASIMVLFHLAPMPPPDTATPGGMFMIALANTGYLTFVKVLELLGAILVAAPKTRNWGLLILGPILVNILAYHIFMNHGKSLDPLSITGGVLALFLLWVERDRVLALPKTT